jgi:hypothetical protein
MMGVTKILQEEIWKNPINFRSKERGKLLSKEEENIIHEGEICASRYGSRH